MNANGSPTAVEHVLVVDDDSVDRIAIRRALGSVELQVEITEVATLAEAREALERGRWRWILSDFVLPDGQGQDVLAAARRHDPHTSVIILTGKGDETLAAELMRQGARDYIPKASLTPDRLGSSMRVAAALADAERIAKTANAGHRFLADSAVALVESIELEDVIRAATRSCVGPYADFCLLDLRLEGVRPRRAGFAHVDGDVEARHRETLASSGPGDGFGAWIEETERDRLVEVDDGWFERMGGSACDALRELAPRQSITLPLRGRGRSLGYLTFVRSRAEPFDELEVPILRRFADKVALALDNARLYHELETAVATRERVLHIVAHDLRNPLGAIVGATANLLGLELPEAARRRQLELIETASGRMSRLVEDLVDVARLDEGRLRITPTTVSPSELIEETVSILAIRAGEEEVAFEVDVAEDAGAVRVDPTRGVQILVNLVDNAIRFSPRGGTIRISARPEDGSMRFAVSDEGPGIAAENLPRLFEPFWQSSGTARKRRSGLGLAIVRGLVELHGGRVGAASEPGGGSELWFTLSMTEG